MSDDPLWSLQQLREVTSKQQELINVVLLILSDGSAEFHDEQLTGNLDFDKARAIAAVAMGAGQSMNTILSPSLERALHWQGTWSARHSSTS